MTRLERGSSERSDLKKRIGSSENEHNGTKYIIVYISRIVCSETEPLNFKLKNTLKLKPKKVALVYDEFFDRFYYFNYLKNGSLSNKKEKIVKTYKPIPNVFFDKKDCINSYLKELAKVNALIEKQISDMKKSQKELFEI